MVAKPNKGSISIDKNIVNFIKNTIALCFNIVGSLKALVSNATVMKGQTCSATNRMIQTHHMTSQTAACVDLEDDPSQT